MFTKNAPSFLLDSELVNRQLRLILFRLLVVLFVTLTGWRFEGDARFSFGSLTSSATLLVLTTLLLTGLYLVWLRFGHVLTRQIRVQLFIDVGLVTWLVSQTGVFISPYGALYVILICLAGLLLGRFDALLLAAVCAVSFTALVLVAPETVLYSITGQVEPSSTSQTIAFNDAAFLFVGLLAARIADRRKIGEDLRQAEANFANLRILHERILFSINSGLVTTDLHGKIFAFNRAAEEITGMQAAEALGKQIDSVFGEIVSKEVDACARDARSGHFPPPGLEIGMRAEDGRDLVLAVTVLPLTAVSRGITGVIVVFHDRTQMNIMAERLKQADEMAAIGRLAAGLAHEVRNPMGAMSSALQFIAERGPADPESAKLMGVALRESERLNSIITNFLAYAQPRTFNGSIAAKAEMDVVKAISDCLALLRHDPHVLDGHVFDLRAPSEPVIMRADESQFKQIIWNLVLNSITAMPAGGRLSIEVTEASEDQLRVVVSDTGCGIAPERMSWIFEPFQSGSNGTGLGLSIVHRLVTERGGRIDVKSEPNSGTSFFLDLPKN